MTSFCKQLAVAVLLVLVTACATKPAVTVYSPQPVPEPEPEQPLLVDEAALRRARILADMLYDAKSAYDDNRLMLPAGNNAYEIYQQVLQLDPGNAVAVQGIEEIALRYVALAESAINLAEYDNAESMLARAMRLSPQRAEIAATRARLEQARKNRVQVHEIDPAGLKAQSLEVMSELAEIAQQIQRTEATFLIRARSDEEGRWIYKTMRDAVGGYRLRGNIDITGTPAVVITTPQGSSG